MEPKIKDTKGLKIMADTIRRDIINMLAEAGSGHTAGPLGMAVKEVLKMKGER